MNRLLATVLVSALWLPAVALAQTPPPGQEKPKETKIEKIDVTGAWDTIIESERGAFNATTMFRQDGEKLTGTMASQMGETALEGTIVGADLTFGMTIDMGGQTMAITYTGKVDGDKISGVVDFGGMGGGNWSATRQKK